MSRSDAGCALLALLVLSPCTCAAAGETLPERVLSLVNDFRIREARPPLVADPRLAGAAQSYAEIIAAAGKFEHDADGSTPRARTKARGYDGCIIGENIAYEYSSRGFTESDLARAFVEGWKESPGHRENMEYLQFSETGIGVARSRDGGHYAVQVFAAPRVSGRPCPRVPRQ